MSRRTWTWAGAALGLIAATVALLAPAGALEAALAPLAPYVPQARPPLGATARGVLALAALLALSLVGWMLGRLLGVRPSEDEAFEDAEPTTVARTPETPSEPVAHLPTPGSRGDNGADRPLVPGPAANLAPATAQGRGAEADGSDFSQQAVARLAEPTAPVPDRRPPPTIETVAAPAVTPHLPDPDTAALAPQAEPALEPLLAKLQAQVDALAVRAPRETHARFEAIDARLAQMTAQLAEIAALARAAARTPQAAPRAEPTPASESPRALPPPSDPDRRRAIAEAARALRERLDGARPAAN